MFHLPLRQTEGFVKSLFSLASLPLPVPCFSTLCRRRLKFEVFRVRREKIEGMVLIVDSSGVKVMGEGEWANRQKGERRRKGWIKVHICIDYKKGQIVEFSLTNERVHESKVFKDLIKGVEGKGLKVKELIMDGAYDREEVWSEVVE
ncbi:transposase [Fervidibacter sacchari]